MKVFTGLFAFLMAFGICTANAEEPQRIKELLNKAYVEGIHNYGNIDDIRNGFHPDFEMIASREGTISRISIEDWIQRIEANRQRNPNPPAEKTTVKYLSVDVTHDVASVKLELHRGGNLIFTDYFFLYKINGEWKILSKVYHAH